MDAQCISNKSVIILQYQLTISLEEGLKNMDALSLAYRLDSILEADIVYFHIMFNLTME